jgi:hypothetical protein
MKIDIAKASSYEGREYDYGEAKLTIRPYPRSRADVMVKDGSLIITGNSMRDMFVYCLTKWEGVTGDNDQPLKLTDDVKRKIYDYKLGSIVDENGETVAMADFVNAKVREFDNEISGDIKN